MTLKAIVRLVGTVLLAAKFLFPEPALAQQAKETPSETRPDDPGSGEPATGDTTAATAPEETASELFDKALMLDLQGKSVEAIPLYEKVVRLDDSREARCNLAKCYISKGDLDAAQKQFERALELAPGNALVLSDMGELAEKRNDLPGAKELFRQATEAMPGEPSFILSLARVQRRLGENEAAAANFRRVVDSERTDKEEEKAEARKALAEMATGE